jgi:pyrimidine 5'-nucleotidase
MTFNTIFFDLDATLYPESSGLWQIIRERIDLYMQERLGLPIDTIPELRHDLFTRYGTTLKGLQANYNIDQHDYLDFVHDLPLEERLAPDPQLRQMLLSLPHRRWIFSNSDHAHIMRVLNRLGIADCFEGIIDIFAQAPYCKPQVEAFQKALDIVGGAPARACAFLDDSLDNIATAKECGFFSILVGENGAHSPADLNVENLLDLPTLAPQLWE